MKLKRSLLIGLVVIILVVLLFVVMFILKNNKENKLKTTSVCIDNKGICFNSELAITEKERATGLMNRESLDPDKGMLFIFDDDEIRSFWMKNTLIPLDIMFINSEMEIVDLARNSQPCPILEELEDCGTISSNKKTMYVLEINAGLSEKNNISIGDKVLFNS